MYSADEIADHVPHKSGGEIAYSDFLAAVLGEKHKTEENLHSLFKILDDDSDNHLTASEIRAHLRAHLKPYSKADVRKMFQEHDVDPDKGMTFEQFKQIMSDKRVKKIEESESQLLKHSSEITIKVLEIPDDEQKVNE